MGAGCCMAEKMEKYRPSSSGILSSLQMVLCTFISVLQIVSSNCPSPAVPLANSHNGTKDGAYPPGTTLIYTCLTGFTAEDKIRICRDDGTWTQEDRVCRVNFISFFIALMSFLGVIMLFVILVSCLFFGRGKQRRPRGINRENSSSSTIPMKDSRSPTPVSSLYNNTKGPFQNGTGSPRMNGSVIANGSNRESYMTDDENPPSRMNSARDPSTNPDQMNISIYTPPPSSPPPSATIPENDLSLPPPPTPVKPAHAAAIMNTNSDPTTSEDEVFLANPSEDEEGGVTNPTITFEGVDEVDGGQRSGTEGDISGNDGERSGPDENQLGERGITRSHLTATFIKQGDGWVHDDASFDSYDEEDTKEHKQHRAAIDAML